MRSATRYSLVWLLQCTVTRITWITYKRLQIPPMELFPYCSGIYWARLLFLLLIYSRKLSISIVPAKLAADSIG